MKTQSLLKISQKSALEFTAKIIVLFVAPVAFLSVANATVVDLPPNPYQTAMRDPSVTVAECATLANFRALEGLAHFHDGSSNFSVESASIAAAHQTVDAESMAQYARVFEDGQTIRFQVTNESLLVHDERACQLRVLVADLRAATCQLNVENYRLAHSVDFGGVVDVTSPINNVTPILNRDARITARYARQLAPLVRGTQRHIATAISKLSGHTIISIWTVTDGVSHNEVTPALAQIRETLSILGATVPNCPAPASLNPHAGQ